jgi:thiol:disulfide interchange protein DsbD
MIWVRKLFGFVLIGMALYYARALLPGPLVDILVFLLFLAAAVYLGLVESSARARFPRFHMFQKAAGACFLAVYVLFFLGRSPAVPGPAAQAPDHHAFTLEVFEAAKGSGRPFIVDFRADWCAPCRKFEKAVLPDPDVRAALKNVPLYTADVTRMDEAQGALIRAFKVAGVPTLLFYDAEGREARRVTAFTGKTEFLNLIQQIQGDKAP